MKPRSLLAALAAGTLLLLGTARAAALDGFVVVAHPGANTANVDLAALKDMFTGKKLYWDGGQAVTLVLLADRADDAIKELSGMNGAQLRTHWQRLAFSGRGQAPKRADSPAALVTTVAATAGAVGIVPADTDLTGVKKIDLK
ncbi:MAG: hypothetical protein KF833_03200 [Verrucomicrobiae bacterium]|nr:hypothetical protein [Verrucomicrobiae bacterium]